MAAVTCPICEQKISTQTVSDLGNNFKEHLMSTHRMQNLSCISMGEAMPIREQTTYAVCRNVTVEREVMEGTPINQEEIRAAGTPFVETVPESGQATSAGKVVSVNQPVVSVQASTREEPPQMIQCPFCTVTFRNDDADDLGDALKEHWGDAHQIRPTIRAELGMTATRERV